MDLVVVGIYIVMEIKRMNGIIDEEQVGYKVKVQGWVLKNSDFVGSRGRGVIGGGRIVYRKIERYLIEGGYLILKNIWNRQRMLGFISWVKVKIENRYN